VILLLALGVFPGDIFRPVAADRGYSPALLCGDTGGLADCTAGSVSAALFHECCHAATGGQVPISVQDAYSPIK